MRKQVCYQQEGDKLNIYKNFNKENGRVNISDGKAHFVKMIVKDVAGNSSELRFYIKGKIVDYGIRNDYLEVNKETKFDDGKIAFIMPKDALYDQVSPNIGYNETANSYSYLYKVCTNDIPVHTYFDLKLKPKSAIPANLATKLAFVRYPYGKDTDKKGKAAKLENGWAKCSVRDFGTYEIVIDQTPPSLVCNLANNTILKGNKIICTAKDETTSIEKFVGKIDGKWVRFVQKGNTFTYEVDSYCPSGNHQLEINVSDENANVKTSVISFTK
jgi:hypothetical protein